MRFAVFFSSKLGCTWTTYWKRAKTFEHKGQYNHQFQELEFYPFRIFIKAKLCIYLFVYVFIRSKLRFKSLLNQERNTELTNNYKIYSIYTPIMYFCSYIHYLVYNLLRIRIQELAANSRSILKLIRVFFHSAQTFFTNAASTKPPALCTSNMQLKYSGPRCQTCMFCLLSQLTH